MITVRREWLAKEGKAFEALDNAKAYCKNFDPSSSWRIYRPKSGSMYAIIIEEDYESLADSEEKWSERTKGPNWEAWILEWQRVAVENTFVVNYLDLYCSS